MINTHTAYFRFLAVITECNANIQPVHVHMYSSNVYIIQLDCGRIK